MILKKINIQRPSYWGGYSFKPYYFEFWEGQNRLNKRTIYKRINSEWTKAICINKSKINIFINLFLTFL